MSTDLSEARDHKAAIAAGAKDVPWYKPELTDLYPACRELLETYSGVEPDRVNDHILGVRERAWSIYAYPCVGNFQFLELSISQHPSYQKILAFLKVPESKHTLLDLGCCFGQDIRKLVHDGCPSENLYACDLSPEFIDLGYDLFKDKKTLKTQFFVADVFQPGLLDDMDGMIDVVHAGSFFHLFSWKDQITVAKRLVKVLKPQKGSLLFGRQTGNLKGRGVKRVVSGVGRDEEGVWRHDPETFKKMWDVVGEETGTKWKTWAQLDEGEGYKKGHWAEEGIRRLRFEVERLE